MGEDRAMREILHPENLDVLDAEVLEPDKCGPDFRNGNKEEKTERHSRKEAGAAMHRGLRPASRGASR